MSRCCRLMCFSSNRITSFPVNCCSTQVAFLHAGTRNTSERSVISLCFLPPSLLITHFIDSLNKLIKEMEGISPKRLPHQWTSVAFFPNPDTGKQNMTKGISVCSPQGPRNHTENYKDWNQPTCSIILNLLPRELVMARVHPTPPQEWLNAAMGH